MSPGIFKVLIWYKNMIRVLISKAGKGYGYDVTGWEEKISESRFYNSLLEEDLVERVGQGDILMYFDEDCSAEEWCDEYGISFEMIKPEEDDNNN